MRQVVVLGSKMSPHVSCMVLRIFSFNDQNLTFPDAIDIDILVGEVA